MRQIGEAVMLAGYLFPSGDLSGPIASKPNQSIPGHCEPFILRSFCQPA